MNIKKIAITLACAAGIAGGTSAAKLENVGVDVVPGEWTSSFTAAKNYAEQNGDAGQRRNTDAGDYRRLHLFRIHIPNNNSLNCQCQQYS